MAKRSMLRAFAVLLLCGRDLVAAASRSGVATSPSVSSAATCPYRTVNYITHTLPLQCRTTSWSGPANSSTVEDQASVTINLTSSQILDHEATSPSAGSASQVSASSATRLSKSSATHPTTGVVKASTASVAAVHGDEPDQESPLENPHFLSFAEWKRQNLMKSGQLEHIGKSRQDDHGEARRRLPNVDTAFDSLGDDAEIDLDFSGFAAEKPQVAVPGHHGNRKKQDPEVEVEQVISPPKPRTRSKDAGTTRKGRFNYASFDCAATILKTNPQASGSTAILTENKDSYMLNECSATNKFLILELCSDILIDTVVLANFEFFSSIFRTFRLSVSDRYPVKAEKWKALGTFEARNTREVQPFLIENPLIWTRYLRIEFLTHYGNEYFCPVSLVRVHGTTMMEDYRHETEANKEEDDEDEDSPESTDGDKLLGPQVVAKSLVEQEQNRKPTTAVEPAKETGDFPVISNTTRPRVLESAVQSAPQDEVKTCLFNKTFEEHQQIAMIFLVPQNTCATDVVLRILPAVKSAPPKNPDHHEVSKNLLGSTSLSSESKVLGTPSQASDRPSNTQNVASPPAAETSSEPEQTHSNATKQSSSINSRPAQAKGGNATQSDGVKMSPSSTQPPAANPTIQESFFKSVQKRLQMLEANSSLSLQYIEEQSRILRDAFSKVEQRQLAKTTTFLNYLNTTVLNELRDFRQQYDQLWQSTVIELETQREQYQKEVLAINARLGILADEVVFQKRVSIMQSVLVLVCLCLVVFSRGTMNNYLELPIVQNMLARSPGLRLTNSPTANTPGGSPAPTRTNSTHRTKPPYDILKRHQGHNSDDSRDEAASPVISYSPPTPTSYDGDSDAGDSNGNLEARSPSPGLGEIPRPRSSPPILPGGEDQTLPSPLQRDGEVETMPNGVEEIGQSAGDEGIPRLNLREPIPPPAVENGVES